MSARAWTDWFASSERGSAVNPSPAAVRAGTCRKDGPQPRSDKCLRGGVGDLAVTSSGHTSAEDACRMLGDLPAPSVLVRPLRDTHDDFGDWPRL